MFDYLTILPGKDKSGVSETFEPIQFKPGELCAIVGETGSGKSRLIGDIEQLSNGESVTERVILLDGKTVDQMVLLSSSVSLVAHLGQNMRFVLDATVAEFISIRCKCREKPECETSSVVLDYANIITSEPISQNSDLNALSGGQTRALMIADTAVICESPIVLIDEIENAGINKQKALDLLLYSGKLILIVTHDPHTALLCDKRIILKNGGIQNVVRTNQEEFMTYKKLDKHYKYMLSAQLKLRKGELLCGI